ncbi:hypothetical protein AC579_9462 [Pseudocercospora musae]|uniref:Uncharacterized protein n=1 Tax=Pseudocercospora musae TaxID=113226 RepID=A0A139I9Y2_9PEZI|nr:hypothetical protein AC579_9462 [Pseudocercospora musae]
MPKKRTYNFRNLEGSSNGKANASNDGANKSSTVNERLSELRRLEGKDAAKKKTELAQLTQTQSRPKQLMRFARMMGEGTGRVDQKPPSLLHLALKSAAESWHLFNAEDLPMLTEMPLSLRVRLLGYLGFYGPSIDIYVLDALTKDQDPVLELDLAGLIGHGSLTVGKVVKLAKLQSSSKELKANSDDIFESWDQEETLETALLRTTLTTRFSQLARLSLSHPPPGVSWKDLLSLSKHIPALTHLSLAYWPRPTLTPNLATATVSSQNSPDITAGGSHFYSATDEDLYEPASILRTLSSGLLRLTWLDLEGCTGWMPALAFHQDANALIKQHDLGQGDGWTEVPAVTRMFVKNWTNLTYINCAQGWLPSLSAMHSLPRQTMPYMHRQIVAKFEETQTATLLAQPDVEESILVAQHKAEKWIHLEDRAFAAERSINALRRTSNVKPVDFDHGWDKDKSLILRRST